MIFKNKSLGADPIIHHFFVSDVVRFHSKMSLVLHTFQPSCEKFEHGCVQAKIEEHHSFVHSEVTQAFPIVLRTTAGCLKRR